MKKILVSIPVVLISLAMKAQVKQQDTVAILIVDRMADFISDMGSCSFKLTSLNDVPNTPSGFVKHFTDYEVFLSGSDKMLVNVHGHKGHRQFWYNGSQFAYYSYDENNYGVIDAPPTFIEMVDSVNAHYDIDFPAADFFYPAFTDDLLQYADTLRYLGMVRMGGKEYYHILARAKQVDCQFWISNDAYNLPYRFSVTYKNKPGNPQYIASFSDWQVNPDLPDAMFDFLPPPSAREVRLMSKNDK